MIFRICFDGMKLGDYDNSVHAPAESCKCGIIELCFLVKNNIG